MSLEIPICELILSQDVVTDLEKCFNGEFFEGRSTKTPDRYLRVLFYKQLLVIGFNTIYIYIYKFVDTKSHTEYVDCFETNLRY